MKIGVHLSWDTPDDWASAARFAVEAERLGVDSIWTGEAWGWDGATPLAYVAGQTSRVRLGTSILKIGARTPALTAMTALSLASMSGDRFVLGLGTSTPQIMEGWDGVPFEAPLRRTRELVDLVRLMMSGERVAYAGRVYQAPLAGDARPMRSSAPPRRVPIYIAAVGPRNLRLTGESADGWIGNCFVPETGSAFLDHLRAGAERAGRSLADLELQAPVTLEFDDDLEAVTKRHARGYAFTFGAMGAPERNFYVAAFARQGFEVVREVHRLWLEGRREEAQELVPPELAWRTNLLGTDATVKEGLRAYGLAGIDSLGVGLRGAINRERVVDLARLLGLVREVEGEGS
ncbi:MAG: LLM class flavin-dependent oxidoreductase [Dehalococcoidia bacterium]